MVHQVFAHKPTGAIYIPYLNYHKGATIPQLLRGQMSVKMTDARLARMREELISEPNFRVLASNLPIKESVSAPGDMFLAPDGYVYTVTSVTGSMAQAMNYKGEKIMI